MTRVVSDEEQYVRSQYKTQDNLNVRVRTHELYGEPRVDFAAWVLEKINWIGVERVVDVGCGSGIYVEPARGRAAHYIATDRSFGMLQQLAYPDLDRVNVDAQALPLTDDSADVILANHMLYHVPDRDAALQEFVRVLRPGGCLLAATNSAHNMAEFELLTNRALDALGTRVPAEVSLALAFTLENGQELLERYFGDVERHDLPGALVFPAPEPVIAYLASSRERWEEHLPAGYSWEDVVAVLDQIISADIAAHGEFRVNKLTGVFVCHN